MDEQEKKIDSTYKQIESLLLQQRLYEALQLLASQAGPQHDYELSNQIEQVRETYRYTIDYLRQGVSDPERSRMHRTLIAQALVLNDLARIVRLTPISSDLYFEKRRTSDTAAHCIERHHRKMAGCAKELQQAAAMAQGEEKRILLDRAARQHDSSQCSLFYSLWTGGVWSKNDTEEMQALLSDSSLPTADAALALAAVTLSLLTLFDPQKIDLLCHAATHPEALVNRRALVGLVMLGCLYGRRFAFYPKLCSRVTALCSDRTLAARIQSVQIQLLQSRETRKIDRKMREEIIPAMVKMQRKTGGNLANEINEEDLNPDWEKWMEKGGLKDKLEEMSELQQEGADVYIATFAQLKSFPFFNELPHWFLPFYEEQGDVAPVLSDCGLKGSVLARALFESPFLCNSDKYSFCLAIKQIPAQQRDGFVEQLNAQKEQMEELREAMDRQGNKERDGNQPANQYVQDLYRFFKLHPRRNQFGDPFREPLNLLSSPLFAPMAQNAKLLGAMDNFLLKKGYYREAAQTIDRELALPDDTRGDDTRQTMHLYQKKGYALQKTGDYPQAIECYRRADLIEPGTLWNLRHLSQCHRILKEYPQALEYSLQAEAIEPDDCKLLLQTGECLVELGRYDEASARFFKADYLKPGNPQAWRAIVWCTLLMRHYDKAERYGEKLMREAPKNIMHDYLNCGHLAWIQGNYPKAVALYRSALAHASSPQEFADALAADAPMLAERGVPTDELPLMRDALLA